MADWPCQNPNCKSHGQAHPNCKCPAPYAKGGRVDHYCKTKMRHEAGCEYFAEGGSPGMSFDDIPSETPSQNAAPEQMEAPPAVEANKPLDFDSLPAEPPKDFDSIPDTDPAGTGEKEPPNLNQHLLAGAEGVAQGVLGPIATLIEEHIPTNSFYSPTKQELADRSDLPSYKAGQAAGLIGSLFYGAGEASLIATATGHLLPEASTLLGKIGVGALRGLIESGALQGGNEISEALLGKGDPEKPISAALSHVGAASLLGATTGGIFGGVSKGVSALGETKVAKNINSMLAGLGAANVASKVEEVSPELQKVLDLDGDVWFKTGVKLHDKLSSYLIESAVDSTMAGLGAMHGGTTEAGAAATVAHAYIAPFVEKLIGKPVQGVTNKYVVPMALKLITAGASPSEIAQGVEYAAGIGKGLNAMNRAVDSVFKAGGIMAAPAAGDYARDKLRKFIDNGDFQKRLDASKAEMNTGDEQDPGEQQYAQGGIIDHMHEGSAPKSILSGTQYLAKHYPDQNILLQAARGRINGYLTSVKPQPQPTLPFDPKPNNTKAERTYTKALDLANAPLSILNEVKRGTISPEHIQHMNAMYPEVYQQLRNKVNAQIVKAQSKNEKIPYRLRQSLGIFLGQPLDSTMTAAGIQAAQATYANKVQAQGPDLPQKPPSGSSMKGISKLPTNYRTPGEARAVRAQRIK